MLDSLYDLGIDLTNTAIYENFAKLFDLYIEHYYDREGVYRIIKGLCSNQDTDIDELLNSVEQYKK